MELGVEPAAIIGNKQVNVSPLFFYLQQHISFSLYNLPQVGGVDTSGNELQFGSRLEYNGLRCNKPHPVGHVLLRIFSQVVLFGK